ncbi:MAG TPA: hypothetical protein VF077_08925 [Nitrospiraceae bacterium]
MAEPTYKNPDIDRFLTGITGRDRRKCVQEGTCMTCGQPAKEFKSELHRVEFTISGMCQVCQDAMFDGG